MNAYIYDVMIGRPLLLSQWGRRPYIVDLVVTVHYSAELPFVCIFYF